MNLAVGGVKSNIFLVDKTTDQIVDLIVAYYNRRDGSERPKRGINQAISEKNPPYDYQPVPHTPSAFGSTVYRRFLPRLGKSTLSLAKTSSGMTRAWPNGNGSGQW